jgi:hypothetical protein
MSSKSLCARFDVLSVEEVGDYVVHSSAYMTYRYRRLLDGTRVDAAARPDALLAHAR